MNYDKYMRKQCDFCKNKDACFERNKENDEDNKSKY